MDMVRAAQRAEAVDFPYVQMSDHFHPWTDRQGQSPFVWSVIAGVAATTKTIRIGTGVTCPMIRTHPVTIAHAAMTSQVMSDGRFFLGVGSGENLNEHIVGGKWPPVEVRQEMLEESIEVMRLLFRGGERSHRGRYFTLEDARLYTIHDAPPPIYVAASGPEAAELAARVGDGLICSNPEAEVVKKFQSSGGDGPRYVELQVCWGEDEEKCRKLAHDLWKTGGIGGQIAQELRRPADFEAVAEHVTQEKSTKHTPVGPDVEAYVDAVREAAKAGFDHIGIHQVGPDQDGFLEFWARELRPALSREKVLAS